MALKHNKVFSIKGDSSIPFKICLICEYQLITITIIPISEKVMMRFKKAKLKEEVKDRTCNSLIREIIIKVFKIGISILSKLVGHWSVTVIREL